MIEAKKTAWELGALRRDIIGVLFEFLEEFELYLEREEGVKHPELRPRTVIG